MPHEHRQVKGSFKAGSFRAETQLLLRPKKCWIESGVGGIRSSVDEHTFARLHIIHINLKVSVVFPPARKPGV